MREAETTIKKEQNRSICSASVNLNLSSVLSPPKLFRLWSNRMNRDRCDAIKHIYSPNSHIAHTHTHTARATELRSPNETQYSAISLSVISLHIWTENMFRLCRITLNSGQSHTNIKSFVICIILFYSVFLLRDIWMCVQSYVAGTINALFHTFVFIEDSTSH